MTRSPDERVTSEIGREICQRQGLKAVIAGLMGAGYSIAGANEKRRLLNHAAVVSGSSCSRCGSTTTLIQCSFPFSLALRRAVLDVCVGNNKLARQGLIGVVGVAIRNCDVGSALPAARVRLDQHQP
jgi:hypothetical protein